MRAFWGALIAAVITIGIAAVAGGLFCAVYTVGEYIVETEYENRYGAQNWEEKCRERKKRLMKDLKYMLKLIAYMALFVAGMLFAGYASDWFVASVYRLLSDTNGRIV